MREIVIEVLKDTKRPITLLELYSNLKLKYNDFNSYELKEKIFSILEDLIASYDVFDLNGKFIHIDHTNYFKGIFRYNNFGGKVIISKRSSEVINDTYEILVPAKNIGASVDGDLVLVKEEKNINKNRVLKVLSSNFEFLYGELALSDDGIILIPADKKYSRLNIKFSDIDFLSKNLPIGTRVLAKVKKNGEVYVSDISLVIGHKDDLNINVLWEAARYGLDNYFSEESKEQVMNLPDEISNDEFKGRVDLTDSLIFTIDGDKTKDMDDAVSCQVLENGNFLLGVHIADVCHYIPYDSPLYHDAFRKATSVYIGGEVFPMLPKEVSNNLCSLKPNVDRLTISCMMEFDVNGNLVNYDIFESVINSKIKFTYSQVNKLLECCIPLKDFDFINSLSNMRDLSIILANKRKENGSIDFDVCDIEIDIDEDNNFLGFSKREMGISENIIAEFMIAANECVDKHLMDRYGFSLHRTHRSPREDNFSKFLNLLKILDISFEKYSSFELLNNSIYMQELNEYINSLDGELSNILTTELIKTMSRAKYSSVPNGHYGLGKDYYCHFTSPIRRFPDYIIHLLLKGKVSIDLIKGQLEIIAKHSNAMQRKVDDAELNVFNKFVKNYASFLEDKVHEAFIVEFLKDGIKVKLNNGMEGIINIKLLTSFDEELYFDRKNLFMIFNGEIYNLADKILVTLSLENDLLSNKDNVNFELIGKSMNINKNKYLIRKK